MPNQSETINEIAAALAKAQGEIKGAVKGRENTYFKSSYADLAAVMEACRAALSNNRIAIVQATEFDAPGNLPISMWLETKLVHSSGQWMSGRYPINPVKEDPQGYGSATTYARRYGLMAMVGVVGEAEDDDGEGAMGRHTETPAKKPTAPSTPKPTDDATRTRAKEWGDKAIKALAKMKTSKEFDDWHTPDTRSKVAAIKGYDAVLHTAILAAIDAVLTKTNPISA